MPCELRSDKRSVVRQFLVDEFNFSAVLSVLIHSLSDIFVPMDAAEVETDATNAWSSAFTARAAERLG